MKIERKQSKWLNLIFTTTQAEKRFLIYFILVHLQSYSTKPILTVWVFLENQQCFYTITVLYISCCILSVNATLILRPKQHRSVVFVLTENPRHTRRICSNGHILDSCGGKSQYEGGDPRGDQRNPTMVFLSGLIWCV